MQQDASTFKTTLAGNKTVLFGTRKLYKTELFIKDTRGYLGIDTFMSKLCEGVFLHTKELLAHYNVHENRDDSCYIISTEDESNMLFFKFGYQINNPLLNQYDIVCYRYVSEIKQQRYDQRLQHYIRGRNAINIAVIRTKDTSNSMDFKRLYSLSNSDQVNFPLLNKKQLDIVMTEDKNILVQGVAGSGKTNICIDKIIYGACREYRGRILYTTFSRGLLIDTQNKVQIFKHNLRSFVDDFREGRIVFADDLHKSAIENKLGIWFNVDDDDRIIEKIQRIMAFLDNNVDYLLIEDIMRKTTDQPIECVGESYFVKHYLPDLKDYNLSANLKKIGNFSREIIYKEIFGMIFGSYTEGSAKNMLTLSEYIEARQDSFSRSVSETIYRLAEDYITHLAELEVYDNNTISRELLASPEKLPQYSLAIIDEVQDFTEVNLGLIKAIARRMFCVGDALQMINPSYFSFSYLKRLMFDREVSEVSELRHNYRNTKKIADTVDSLSELNIKQFGTHGFIQKGVSVDSNVPTSTIYAREAQFVESVINAHLDDFTIIVSSEACKTRLREKLKRQEILTVAEIKGLERNTVVLYNILSDNLDKWQTLQRQTINRKKADENSVFRYYFNLLYVGVSRAKQHLYVVENSNIPLFNDFFATNFTSVKPDELAKSLAKVVATFIVDDVENSDRIDKFIHLQQFDNARFAASQLSDSDEVALQNERINIYEHYVSRGQYRNAGIQFWKNGLPDDAKKQFVLSGDETLIALVDASLANNSGGLSYDVIEFYEYVEDNDIARNLIVETIASDLATIKDKNKNLKKLIASHKE